MSRIIKQCKMMFFYYYLFDCKVVSGLKWYVGLQDALNLFILLTL